MNDIRTLTTSELQQRLDRDSGLHLVNVQTDQFFNGELIPGSRRAPLDSLTQGLASVPKDADIVTYCAGPTCTQGEEAARQLLGLGYTNVRSYLDGLEGWKAAGNEIVKPEPLPAA
jgi:rhodanese-related sulfurtransferase